VLKLGCTRVKARGAAKEGFKAVVDSAKYDIRQLLPVAPFFFKQSIIVISYNSCDVIPCIARSTLTPIIALLYSVAAGEWPS